MNNRNDKRRMLIIAIISFGTNVIVGFLIAKWFP